MKLNIGIVKCSEVVSHGDLELNDHRARYKYGKKLSLAARIDSDGPIRKNSTRFSGDKVYLGEKKPDDRNFSKVYSLT